MFWHIRQRKKPANLLICRLLMLFVISSSDPAGIRTQDPYIKSVLLYQLSYGIVFRLNLKLFDIQFLLLFGLSI